MVRTSLVEVAVEPTRPWLPAPRSASPARLPTSRSSGCHGSAWLRRAPPRGLAFACMYRPSLRETAAEADRGSQRLDFVSLGFSSDGIQRAAAQMPAAIPMPAPLRKWWSRR